MLAMIIIVCIVAITALGQYAKGTFVYVGSQISASYAYDHPWTNHHLATWTNRRINNLLDYPFLDSVFCPFASDSWCRFSSA